MAKTSITKAKPSKKKSSPASTPHAAPLTPEMAQAFTRGFCLRVIVGGPSFRRRVDSDEIEAGEADVELLHVSKETLQCEEYDALQHSYGEMKKYLAVRSLPVKMALLKGTYFIPLDLHTTVMTWMEAWEQRRTTVLVPALVEAYKTAKSKAKERLKQLYNEVDYPAADALAAAFYVELWPIQLAPDGKLKDLNSQLYQKTERKLQEQYAAAALEMRQLPRIVLHKMLVHLTERLRGTTGDGRPKALRIYESAVTHITEFIEFFAPKNVTDDAAMSDIVGKLKQVMAGVDIETLRDDATYRTTMNTQMTAVLGELAKLVGAAPRKIKIAKGKEVA